MQTAATRTKPKPDLDVVDAMVHNPLGFIVPNIKVNPVGEIQYWEPRVETKRQLRDDPLGRLWHHGQIGRHQYQAGREMQKLYEHSEVGYLRSQDPSNEPVDGGGHIPDIMSDRQLTALRRINALYPVLGKEGSAILVLFLKQRLLVSQIAQTMGQGSSKAANEYMGRRVRECLSTLAREFGYAGADKQNPAGAG